MKSLFTFLLVTFLVLAFMWAAGLGFYTIKIISAKPAMSAKKTDAIIVLTGGNFRIETGMQLWSDNLAQDLLSRAFTKTYRAALFWPNGARK